MHRPTTVIGTVGCLYEVAKGLGMRSVVALDGLRRWRHGRLPGIHRIVDGDVSARSKPILCIFAHFDRDDLIDDYVVHYVKQLFDSGCEIIFVSTAEGLSEAQCERVKPFTRQIVVRENVGHDFGSWKTAICQELAGSESAFSGFDGLIIANDSVYGPIRPLPPIVAEMSARGCDFCGITDSWRYFHHVQSYFVLFDKRVACSKTFHQFWINMPYYHSKHAVIWKGEIGLSRTLVQAGFKFDVLCGYEDLRARHARTFWEIERRSARGRPVNATHYFWELLVTEQKCPFLKVQLLRDNPKDVPNMARWKELLDDGQNGLKGMIESHLTRVSRGE